MTCLSCCWRSSSLLVLHFPTIFPKSLSNRCCASLASRRFFSIATHFTTGSSSMMANCDGWFWIAMPLEEACGPKGGSQTSWPKSFQGLELKKPCISLNSATSSFACPRSQCWFWFALLEQSQSGTVTSPFCRARDIASLFP